jgi:hypothetical protein
MPDPAPQTAELRRTTPARLRTSGVVGVMSWVFVVLGAVEIVQGSSDGFLVAVFAAALTWRIAIATEYVHCDADGLAWRSVFLSHHVPWQRVAAVETAVVHNHRWWGRMTFPAASLVVVLPNGVQLTLSPSIWCSIMDHAEFIAAARLISPLDWAEVEDGTVNVVRTGRGRRVGRPIPRRRRRTGA